MARAKIPVDEGESALAIVLDEGPAASSDRMAVAVRYTLQVLAETAKGNAVEVRIPPYGVVQCVSGPGHTRGTPANVVETDGTTWLALATGRLDWQSAVTNGRVRASGSRADLKDYLPLRGALSVLFKTPPAP